jgi:hypothetical protein
MSTHASQDPTSAKKQRKRGNGLEKEGEICPILGITYTTAVYV